MSSSVSRLEESILLLPLLRRPHRDHRSRLRPQQTHPAVLPLQGRTLLACALLIPAAMMGEEQRKIYSSFVFFVLNFEQI